MIIVVKNNRVYAKHPDSVIDHIRGLYNGFDLKWVPDDFQFEMGEYQSDEAGVIFPIDPYKDSDHVEWYAGNRKIHYPSFNEYLDGIVKEDEAQLDAYTDACMAVKARFPKPIE